MKDFCTSPHHSANLAAARAWQAAIHAGDAKAVNCDCSEVAALAEAAAIRAALADAPLAARMSAAISASAVSD